MAGPLKGLKVIWEVSLGPTLDVLVQVVSHSIEKVPKASDMYGDKV